jgi:hypothetical protein
LTLFSGIFAEAGNDLPDGGPAHRRSRASRAPDQAESCTYTELRNMGVVLAIVGFTGAALLAYLFYVLFQGEKL